MYDDRPDVQARLRDATVAWLTTVNAEGQPQPSAVWLVMIDDAIVIYSKEGTPRLRNIRANPRVSLNLNSDVEGDSLLIIEGEAEIIGTDVPPSADPDYTAKYATRLPRWNFTWASYDKDFPVRLHIHPQRLRD